MKPIELFKAGDFERKIPLEFFGSGPKSFEFCWTSIAETCSALANAKFHSWLKSAVRVYYSQQFPHLLNLKDKPMDGFDTHTALLICVEKIEKECVHEPIETNSFDGAVRGGPWTISCKHCHVKLQPLGWKAVE